MVTVLMTECETNIQNTDESYSILLSVQTAIWQSCYTVSLCLREEVISNFDGAYLEHFRGNLSNWDINIYSNYREMTSIAPTKPIGFHIS